MTLVVSLPRISITLMTMLCLPRLSPLGRLVALSQVEHLLALVRALVHRLNVLEGKSQVYWALFLPLTYLPSQMSSTMRKRLPSEMERYRDKCTTPGGKGQV